MLGLCVLGRPYIRGKHFASLDVTSLFTNVPIDDTISVIIDHIKSKCLALPIPVDDLEKLLRLCTVNVQFMFDGTFYRQIDGVAMGSPLGPVLADIFMGQVTTTLRQICNLQN